MIRKTLGFDECEHNGDLDLYVSDLRRSGATVTYATVNEDEETGTVVIEVPESAWVAFVASFKGTDSFGFVYQLEG